MAQTNSLMMELSKNRQKPIFWLIYFFSCIISQSETKPFAGHPIMAQTYNEIENTFKLLEMGDKQMKLLDEHKSVTLVVGNTGSGKSTLIQWLAGKNQNTLKSTEIEKGLGDFIIEDGNRIGTTVMSQTLFPELVIDNKNNASIYDCPGFSDTRSSSYDIAATYFVKKLTEHVQFVKLLVAVNYSSVRAGVDRKDFPDLLKRTLDLVKNVEKFKDSIAIVVTKVDNTYLKGSGLVPDETVISSIASYFRKVQNTFEAKLKLPGVSEQEKIFCSKAITLLNIFLTEKNGTTYPRIQIFRRPNEAGLLKNIPLLESRKKNLEKMIHEELKFTEKGPNDFGYAISDGSKNDVQNLVSSINDKVASIASAIVIKVQNYYEKVISDNDAVLKSYETLLNVTDAHESERAFAEQLEQDHRAISEFYTVSKNITSISDLAYKTETCIITTLGIISCRQEVENLALQAKYLNFLELVSSRTFTTRPRDWWNEFEKMGTYLGTYLAGIEIFDGFLNQMLKKLSEYDIQKEKSKYNVANLDDWGSDQKNPGININQNNYKQFLGKLENKNLIGTDAQIKKLPVTDFQLRKLNHVLYLTLKKPWNHRCLESGKLVIQGGYLKFSDFLDTNGKLINLCKSGKILSLDLFALNTLFIDRDLKEHGIELNIVAPKVELIGHRSINVDGAPGPSQLQAETTATYRGAQGIDGLPGLPGEPGGNVLAIAEIFVSGQHLAISADGGHGGQGQQGGDGVRGEDGANARLDNHSRKFFIRDDKIVTVLYTNIQEQWRFYGLPGATGGRGGDGGLGGFGGEGGKIKVFRLDGNSNLPLITFKPGPDGKVGQGGDGGRGGKYGDNLWAKYCTHWITAIPTGDWCDGKSEYSSSRASYGSQGSAGGSEFLDKTKPKQGKPFQSISETVRNYKFYLRENLRDYFNTTIFTQFVQEIDNNEGIKSSYDTLALVNELQDLEKQFQSQHPQDFLPFYESLLKRTSEYAKNPKHSEKSTSHKIILTHLYTATLGKIQMLKKKFSDSNLIIDLYKYLNSIQQYISDLKDFKEKSTKMKVVKEVRENYQRNIDEKIKNAEYLIQTQVTPNINTVGLQINQEIDNLLDETTALKENARDRKYDLQKQKEKFNNNLIKSRILSVVKVIGQVISYMGPVGAIANDVLTTVTTVAEGLSSAASTISRAPNDFSSKIQSMGSAFKTLKGQPFTDFKNQLNTLFADTEKYPRELNDTSKLIKTIEKGCDEALANSDNNKLKELKNKLQTHLAEKLNTGAVKKMVSGASWVVKKFKKLSPLGETGMAIYKKIQDDNSQLEVYDAEIQKAEKEIQAFEQYQEKIHEEMIPVFANIGENLNSMAVDLNNKSQVVLDVSQWKVQSFLKDVKYNMQQLTKGFSVEHNLQRCIEKLDETITTVINIYDRIQGYQDQQQLGVYIADISSPTVGDIDIANPALISGMVELQKIISSNLVFEQHKAAVNALTQHVFPFAFRYLDSFKLTKSIVPQEPNYQSLVREAVEEVKGLQLKMTEYKTSITISDSFMRTTQFSTDYKISKPFYVWKNHEYQEEISKLLSGEKVMLKANVLKSVSDKDAIKFNKISLKFNSENTTLTQKISHQLNGFSVHATHMGNSYYRLNNNVYIIASAQQKIHFSFEKDANNKPVDRNSIYDKIESGDAMLSPYAMWEIQLVNTVNDIDFTVFEKYKTMVDLELEGSGCYVTKEANISDVDVQNYYTVAETVLDDLHPRKRELRMPVMYEPKELRPTSVNTVIPSGSATSVSAGARISPWLAKVWKTLYEILLYNF